MKYTLIPRSHEACKKRLSCEYLQKTQEIKKDPKHKKEERKTPKIKRNQPT